MSPDVVRVLCPPFVALAAVRDALPGTGVEVGAQNVHARARRRLHRRDLRARCSPASPPGRSSATPSGDATRARRTRSIGRKLVRCAEAGLRPILCVGEQLAEREAGRAEATVRAQLEGALAVVLAQRCLAGGPGHRLRAGVGHRDRPDGARRGRGGDGGCRSGRRCAELGAPDDGAGIPVLYGGSVTSGRHGEFLAEPAIDGALVGGASLKVDEMAGIVARAGVTAEARRAAGAGARDHSAGRAPAAPASCCSSSMASASAPTRRSTPSPRPGLPAWRGAARAWPHSLLDASGPAVGLPDGPDGQQRGRATSTSAPAGRSSRTCRVSTPPSTTARSSPTRRWWMRHGPRSQRGRRLHLVEPHRAGRRPCQRPPPRGDRGAGATRGRSRRRRPRAARWPRHAAAVRWSVPCRLSRRGSAWRTRGARRDRSVAATTAWIATSAGSASSPTTRALVHGVGPVRADRGGRARGRIRAWRERRVRAAHGDAVSAAPVQDGDVVIHCNFRADRARELTHALVDDDFAGFERLGHARATCRW